MPKHSKRHAYRDVVSIADFTSWTNKKMILMNAGKGGTLYPHCNPFTVDEVMKHIGKSILNGLSPSPQTDMKFQSSQINEVNESDILSQKFGPRAALQHHDFKAFLQRLILLYQSFPEFHILTGKLRNSFVMQ